MVEHDPFRLVGDGVDEFLGRTSGICEASRQITQTIPGIEFAERAENREFSICCGGGGDAEMAAAELTAAVGRHRLQQAQQTGATVVISARQHCNRALTEAARRNQIHQGTRQSAQSPGGTSADCRRMPTCFWTNRIPMV